MDESEIQRKRRENEEEATRRRATLLGYNYIDTREFENSVELIPGVLDVAQMRAFGMIPLQKGNEEKPIHDHKSDAANTSRHSTQQLSPRGSKRRLFLDL